MNGRDDTTPDQRGRQRSGVLPTPSTPNRKQAKKKIQHGGALQPCLLSEVRRTARVLNAS